MMLPLGSRLSIRAAFVVTLMSCALFALNLRADVVIDEFEYPSTEDLDLVWIGNSRAIASLSDDVAPGSLGISSMGLEFTFPRSEWTTQTVRGSLLPAPISMAEGRYISFRIKGDPAFAVADFRNLYLYAYDASGKFGRWGVSVPVTDEWQVFNAAIASIEQPYDSTGLPDLTQIVRFAWFQYGSQAAIDPYTATVHIDDLAIRDTPLTEFPPASLPRPLVDDFESYATLDDLLAAYRYEVSPASTVATAGLLSPAAQGKQALSLSIDFAAGQYPWGSVRSKPVQPFSFPSNAVVSLRFKGDPGLGASADEGTSFWLSFYDRSGRGMHLIRGSVAVIASDWITVQGTLQDFTDAETVDVGNLVEWRILVQAWTGTAESQPISGLFSVDDIRIEVPPPERPVLALSAAGALWKLTLTHLVAGKTYQVQSSQDLSSWATISTFVAPGTSSVRNLSITKAWTFYRAIEKPAN